MLRAGCALSEAVNRLYKTELICRRGPWRAVEQVELATLEYVWWWNNQRLCGGFGMSTRCKSRRPTTLTLESARPTLVSQGNR